MATSFTRSISQEALLRYITCPVEDGKTCHALRSREIHRLRKASQCQDMMIPAEPALASLSQAGPFPDQPRLAVTAYLARFKGSSREHTESDLRCYHTWCAERDLDPLAAQRLHLELYIRWMQETRRFRPSTISRRFSVTARFYRRFLASEST